MPLPDDFSSARYRNAYERPIIAVEPDPHAATRADIYAMMKARAWLVVSLTSLRNNPWSYDSTHIPPHAMLLADAEAFLKQMDDALAEARMSWEASW